MGKLIELNNLTSDKEAYMIEYNRLCLELTKLNEKETALRFGIERLFESIMSLRERIASEEGNARIVATKELEELTDLNGSWEKQYDENRKKITNVEKELTSLTKRGKAKILVKQK